MFVYLKFVSSFADFCFPIFSCPVSPTLVTSRLVIVSHFSTLLAANLLTLCFCLSCLHMSENMKYKYDLIKNNVLDKRLVQCLVYLSLVFRSANRDIPKCSQIVKSSAYKAAGIPLADLIQSH